MCWTESMVGGPIFHRDVIQREISRALVLNLSGKTRCSGTAEEIFVLDNAFALIEASPRWNIYCPRVAPDPTGRSLSPVESTANFSASLICRRAKSRSGRSLITFTAGVSCPLMRNVLDSSSTMLVAYFPTEVLEERKTLADSCSSADSPK